MIGIYTERFDTDPADAIMAMGGVGDLVAAGPAIIKIHNSKAQLKWAHNHGSANDILLYRNIAILEEPFYGNAPSAAFADTYWAAILPHITNLQYAVVNVYPNEPSVDPASLQQLDSYFARLAVLARSAGYTIAAYAFSAEGAAALADGRYTYLAKSFKALKDNGHWADFHGYFPKLDDPVGAQFVFPWRTVRPLVGANMPPVLAGELGIDTNLAMGRYADGYRTIINNEEYARQLLWANGQLKADNVPACIYLATRANAPDDQIQYNILIDDSRKNDPNPSVWDRIKSNISDTWVGTAPPIEIPPTDPPPTQPPITGPIIKPGWNVRWTPNSSNSANILTTTKVNTPVEVVGDSGEFKKVVVYVHRDAFQ